MNPRPMGITSDAKTIVLSDGTFINAGYHEIFGNPLTINGVTYLLRTVSEAEMEGLMC